MPYLKDMSLHDPYALIDRVFMQLYRHGRSNMRRITRLIVTILPLMLLLVGSCKTSQLPWVYGSNTGPAQFRMALFPDRVNFKGDHYYPAAGYISRARTFIAGTPDNLMRLTQQEIGYLFGKPTLHRQDADAEVWQYKTAACVVDFYFYNRGNALNESPLSHTDIRLKAEMVPGSHPRTAPLSTREKSDCLHHVVTRGFFSVHA